MLRLYVYDRYSDKEKCVATIYGHTNEECEGYAESL